MADKRFGVKQINLIGASGTPTLTSPNNLNINATTVAISTDVTVGGQVLSNVIVGSGYSVGLGTTVPGGSLDVYGTTQIENLNVTGVTTFTGNVTSVTMSQLNVTGIVTASSGRIQANADSNLRFGNLAAGSGSSRNIAIGDQVLSSLSGGTGRNIGIGELSYYDTDTGSYNIGLGIQAGQKITSGSYNVIIGGYNGQTGLDLRTSSNNVVIADGQGNIRQYIDSTGNVGIKTTTASEALTVTGVVSATSFYGTLNADQLTGVLPVLDGSNLFGVTAAGSGVQIRDDGSIVGTAATIDFANGLGVSFGSGIATITGITTSDIRSNTLTVSGVSTFSGTLNADDITILDGIFRFNSSADGAVLDMAYTSSTDKLDISYKKTGDLTWYIPTNTTFQFKNPGGGNVSAKFTSEGTSALYYAGSNKIETAGAGVTVTGITSSTDLYLTNNAFVSGILTASSFYGSGANLTNLPAGQLTGTLPAIDGSALLNINATGEGIVVEDNAVNVGSARTVNFGTGLDVTYSSSGIATISASGGSLQSRTIVSGITTAIVNNGIGNTDITGFKSYSLLKVGLSTAAWLRLYTDSTSRANDTSRSVGEDPLAGSGVIAEVVTTGVSTSQIISPFVMGGNLDTPAATTIYAAITNLSGITSTISVDLTILQLEA